MVRQVYDLREQLERRQQQLKMERVCVTQKDTKTQHDEKDHGAGVVDIASRSKVYKCLRH